MFASLAFEKKNCETKIITILYFQIQAAYVS